MGLNKREHYRRLLATLPRNHIEPYLLQESGLPGKRANLELAAAVADIGDRKLFDQLSAVGRGDAPADSPGEFLTVCGIIGLGRLLAEGDLKLEANLRAFASDPRWRVREGVAMALQRVGMQDMNALLHICHDWLDGNFLELRAVAAGLCEPCLLHDQRVVVDVLDILDSITQRLVTDSITDKEAFRVLKKALGYCWSVAVAACPGTGWLFLERWAASGQPDARWVVAENLKKNRLTKLDPERVRRLERVIRGESD